MPGDAFMEVSTYQIMGETGDEVFGRKDYGGFEISSLDFHTGATAKSGKNKVTTQKGKDGTVTKTVTKDDAKTNTPAGDDQDTRKGEITITKAIDKASPAL